jgi:hypothetical protein
MLKTISKAGFDVVAVLTMIVTVFYLAAMFCSLAVRG